ncbi:arginine--tRNA ligase [bacterium]|nr:MAG: arginine--tRNA ligase [bacterium]
MLRDAPHPGLPDLGRPHHRRLPAEPAGTGPRAGFDGAQGGRQPDPHPPQGRQRPRGVPRGDGRHPRRRQPHPRGQDPHALRRHRVGRQVRDDLDGPAPGVLGQGRHGQLGRLPGQSARRGRIQDLGQHGRPEGRRVIVEELRAAAAERLAALAREKGGEAPAGGFAPAPAHVKADAALSWPLAAAKVLKKKPLDLAAEAAAALAGLPGLASAEPAPPGFINVAFSQAALGAELARLLSDPASAGRDPSAAPRDILLEFVSANPTGPVHLATSRAATLGDSLARILRRRGHKVRTEYYVNDAGKQVERLGQSVRARWDQAHGKDTPVPEKGYQGEYIAEIAKAAPASAELWTDAQFARLAIDTMLAQHRADMELFGVGFDRWYLESELHAAGAVGKTLEKLKSLGKAYEKEGATWLGTVSDDTDDDKDRVLVRQDGVPTYFLADIAYHEDKYARGARELIDVWGADHHGYVPRMKAAVAALGHPPESFHPIVHQLVHLIKEEDFVKVAMKMSKRKGNFITLRELVDVVGLDATRFFFAMRTPNTHMQFDWELAQKKSNDNPVFYVQYVHARIASIFREAKAQGLAFESPDWALLTDPAERALAVKLAWLPETLKACEKELSPHPLPTYLMELAGLYHAFYERCRVLAPEDKPRTAARLALCGAVKNTLKEALGLLGVSAPEEM